ncbi:helix-turn-helix domain-containing protein [Chitinophaga filiformis]|uniref:AraC-type DNA-binding protein n=1 Tax=Chitinophaga filiformis TaxID=104663 RepID=A0A1G7S4P6_CHIFI|nr:AraC family transcriptional regulator [Chitinophaga filiformis]SDG17922.1 AraC-type DNA-binding protein [Chitinophaga filiformis]
MELVVFVALHFELNARSAGETASGSPPLQVLLDLIKSQQGTGVQPLQIHAGSSSPPQLPPVTVSSNMTRYLDHLSGTMQENGTNGYELGNITVELLTEYQEKQALQVHTETALSTTMMLIRNEVMLNPNIHEHSLRVLAKKHFINEKTLSRAFTKTFGVKISDFILEQVMQRARYLLENTQRTVADIAEELGYSNDYNFSRTFKNMYGIYPTELRKKITAPKRPTY